MRRRVLFAAAAALLATALLWWLRQDPEVAPRTPAGQAPASAATPSVASPPADHPPGAEPRQAAPDGKPDPNAATKGLQLRVRLRGLHRDAPWTAMLQLDVDGLDQPLQAWLEHDAAATPDHEGIATFPLPDWYTTAVRKVRIRTHDAHYLPIDRRWGALDPARELELDVQVVATLSGRVVDEQQAPIAAARIVAFSMRDGAPIDGELARTNTRTDGTFRISVPPEASLFLLVAPMEESAFVTTDGSQADSGDLRTDLLPSSMPARATIGDDKQLGDIVLARAANVVGTVRWQDGPPVAHVAVRAQPRDGTTLRLDDRAFVQRHPDGRLSPGATVGTEEDGSFLLPALPGAPLDVAVRDWAHVRVIGQFLQAVVPPQRADFSLPRPIRLRATDGQQPVPRALVEIEAWGRLHAGDDGVVALVTPRALRVRATHERLWSPWLDVPASAAGTTVDVVMTNARVPLAIEFTGDFRVRNTVITWRSETGQEGREHLLRDDSGGPFQLFLPSGQYHVTAGPGGGERNGVFLLPVERDVDLTSGPQTLTLPAVFGGTFTVMATDSGGVWVGGTCQLLNGAGVDVTERFRVQQGTNRREGQVGELLADGTNEFTRVLPPGDYELMCDFRDHGASRQRVTIRPREVAEVRIRLP